MDQPQTTIDSKYFYFLDDLRESGDTNMLGADTYLLEYYPELDKSRAREILRDWMETFPRS